ncbi:hypothetical protein [Rhodoferax sp.]|uniref:hypothetical protein n=1 Tax=Rhodoferax sp. TaxID=50421 RepID=UPI00274DA682|nr:hypothetical protein [Rhodoferax sp.]
MNYSDLITMVVLIVVPAIAAWWWIQKSNGRNGAGQVRPSDASAAKRDAPK